MIAQKEIFVFLFLVFLDILIFPFLFFFGRGGEGGEVKNFELIFHFEFLGYLHSGWRTVGRDTDQPKFSSF